MSDYISFSERPPEFKNFTEEEWNFVNTFTYDDQNEFNDLRILKMQNNHRVYHMWDELGIPPDSSSFCTAFNKNRERTRLIQRHICSNHCFWDPRNCFLSHCHSGNLEDIMHQDFHENFNPEFKDQFDRRFSGKIDWVPTGGPGHFPSVGVKKLIEELGITTKLIYDEDQYAINFNNLSKDLRNDIPDRPIYIIEVKKCHDIIEALLNINRKEIEKNKREMTIAYDESYKGNGLMREPILSLMMWGPLTNHNLRKSDAECKFDPMIDRQSGVHACSNFSEKHYWMFTHSPSVACIEGTLKNLEGPVMTSDLTFVYPCNRTDCNHNCLCQLCINSFKCSKDQHKNHIKEIYPECDVDKSSQCQEHQIDHPKNFDNKEDISVQKNIFYHNLELQDQPRRDSVENLTFAGIKKACDLCCLTVKDHFKHHKVVHLNCKYCIYQLRTSFDKKFWEKVCNICGKIFSNVESLEYWHKRTHTSDWKCYECDTEFSSKWNLKRHLIEIHNIDYEATDDESGSSDIESDNDPFSSYDMTEHEDTENESDNFENEKLRCAFCDKEFSVQRYLDSHLKNKHSQRETFTCDKCDKAFTQKKHMKRHRETVHGVKRPDVLDLANIPNKNICTFCGSKFTRADNLNEHIQRAHLKTVEEFTCKHCGKKFSRKWNLSRHEDKCISNVK